MNITFELINWYLNHKRDLPWRNTKDPYLIWLSEIILQQTRVSQGLPYYIKFSETYPTIVDFANANEDDILRIWQGLGYYSRGRNMLFTAKQIVANSNGIFPSSYDELIKLKGIGDYTASAISSFAINEVKAVLDGNVFRVLSRLFNIDTPINSTLGWLEFKKLANELLDKKNPALHNQAIMEFGALQCVPKNPNCSSCIFNDICLAKAKNKVNQLPVKVKKLKIKDRFITYFYLKSKDYIILKRRDNKDTWAGLYDFPSIESQHLLSEKDILNHPNFIQWFSSSVIIKDITKPVKHVLTHQRILARYVILENFLDDNIDDDWIKVPIKKIDDYGKPKLIFDFLKKYLP